MSIAFWRIATDTPDYTADDRRGLGAKATGGRWNRPGTAMLYAAPSIALACLETVVHLKTGSLPLNRYLVRVDIPPAVWGRAQTLRLDQDSVGWDAQPAGMVSLTIGERWIASRSSALLLVPSVIVPEEHNLLIDPSHPDMKKIRLRKLRRFVYDERLHA